MSSTDADVPLPRRPLPSVRGGGRLGPYEVVRLLGQGAMGRVLHVRDATGRDLALKLLIRMDASPRALTRFQREAELTAAVRHPGIVGVHDAGVVEGWPFITFDFVPGGRTLEDAFEELPLGPRVALMVEAGQALGAAHAAGIVHRDLKPANVLVDEHGHARVADFGLAQAVGLERLTRTGALVGTPHYMAPEQVAGHRDAFGPRTDVWAMGVILYRALTLKRPFQGKSLPELAARIARAAPERPSALNPEVSRALDAVCLRALAKEPEDRYADGAAFAADLARALDPSQGPPEALRVRWRWLRHWPWALAAASVLTLAFVAALVVPQPQPAAPPPSSPSATASATPASQAARRLEAALADADPQAALQRLEPEAIQADPTAQARLVAAQAEAAAALQAYVRATDPPLLADLERMLTPLAALARLRAPGSPAFPDADDVANRSLRRMIDSTADGLPVLELLADCGARITDQRTAIKVLELWELGMPRYLAEGSATPSDVARLLALSVELDMAYKRGVRVPVDRPLLHVVPTGDDVVFRYIRARFEADQPTPKALLLRWRADPPPELRLGPVHRAELDVLAAMQTEDPAARLPLLESAVATDPGCVAAWFPLAVALADLGRFAEGAEAMTTALRLYHAYDLDTLASTVGRYPTWLGQATYVYGHADRRPEARATYAKLLRVDHGRRDASMEQEFPWLADVEPTPLRRD